uniref:Uncharacterized protein KIAA0355-like n=1 Tax=Saccoglossus kowalevskii TaxID=10224 RepID=A0ABM0M1B2_SACKO|nr:PREDICTED: uncharacterized protein KIAA0355-like [Saccoglossus kowalevskii]
MPLTISASEGSWEYDGSIEYGIQPSGRELNSHQSPYGCGKSDSDGLDMYVVLAKCFLSMMQTQIQFYSTAVELMCPLSQYNDIIDIIHDYEDDPTMKEACHSWLAASQSTGKLRLGGSLTSDEIQLLLVNQEDLQPEQIVIDIRLKYEASLQRYGYELSRLPSYEHTLVGGFLHYPQCLSLVLKGCCNDNEIQAIGSQSNPLTQQILRKLYQSQSRTVSQEEWKELVQKEVCYIAMHVDETFKKMCTNKSMNEENFNTKLDTICALVREISEQAALDLPIEEIALVSHRTSQIAVQILYARSNLVSVFKAPGEGDLQQYAQVSADGTTLIIEVPTIWWLIDELIAESGYHPHNKLAVIEATYTVKIDLLDWNEGRCQCLPTIHIKLCKNSVDTSNRTFDTMGRPLTLPPSITSSYSAQAAGQLQSTSESPTSGLRKTFTKLTSKFARKSSPATSPTSKSGFHTKSVFSVPTNQNRDSDEVNQSVDCDNVSFSPAGDANYAKVWQRKPMQQIVSIGNPTVTITTDTSPDEEKLPDWSRESKPGTEELQARMSENIQCDITWKASEEQLDDVINLLSGGPAKPQQPLEVSKHISPWKTVDNTQYDNFNPCYNEGETIDRNTESSVSWSMDSNGSRGPFHESQTLPGSHGYDPEFAKYLATNIPGRRSHSGYHGNMSDVNTPSWLVPESRLNRSWPINENTTDHNSNNNNDPLSMSWTGGQDSGSSSDDSSSNNGENVFNMGLGLTAPDLVASLNRRRHSSGGEHDNEDNQHKKYLDVMMESNTTKTWPPKLVWQRAPSKPPPPTNNQNFRMLSLDHLGLHPSIASQWGDPLPQGSSVWSTADSPSNVPATNPPVSFNSPGQSVRTHPKLDRKFSLNVHNFHS